ncbi:MAG: tRNA (adenosine(37)-N6)-dimethylallyltransferase MiaA [bacterium]
MNKLLITIEGPTGIGKTSLAIALAKHFNTEIVSADSRQFFKEMAIGTAVPSSEELNQVKHHFIQHISIHDTYTVGHFEKEAINCIEEIHNKHDIAILVGGSGLYVNAVTEGLDEFPEISPEIRQKLNETLKNEGLEALQKKLEEVDPKSYNAIEIDNPHRVIRALEVSIGSGEPYSSFLGKPKKTRPFSVIKLGITADRKIIYDRIEQRVDLMVQHGLIEEVKALKDYQHLNALNTVGYKEIFQYLDKQISLEFAIEEIKKNTRRFAKRQLTWLRKDKNILWVDFDAALEDVIIQIEIKQKASQI